MNGRTRRISMLAVVGVVGLGFLAGCGGGGSSGAVSSGGRSSGSGSSGSGSSGGNIGSTTTANAVPAIIYTTPSCAPAAAQTFTLNVGVRNPVANSVLRWNGTDLPSTVDTNAQLISAQIPASDLATAGTATITVFNPEPGGGSSSPVSFGIVVGGAYPMSVAVDPAGGFTYVVNAGCGAAFSGSVSMYKIEPTGTLTSLGTIPAGSDAVSIAIDPSGGFAYVVNNGSQDVWTYAMIPGTGVLALSGKTALDVQPGHSWVGLGSITIDPLGGFAYLANSLANDISMYTIDPHSGAVTSIAPPVQETGPLQTPFDGPSSVTVDPLGKFAYVPIRGDGGDMSDGSLSVYRINSATGVLTFTSRVEGSCGASVSLCGPVSVAIDHSGKFAVAVGWFGGISMYAVDTTTGALTSIETLSAGTNPTSVALNTTSHFVYVTNYGSNDVSQYSVDPNTMTLTSMGRVAAGSGPTSIAIDPSGKFAYVANDGSNNVSMYGIDPVTGALTLLGTIGT